MAWGTAEAVAGRNQKWTVWMWASFLLFLCSHSVHTQVHTQYIQTCINLHTEANTYSPSAPLGAIFCVSGFLADCRCSAINSPLIEVKKQQEEEKKALILEKQLRDPVDKAVFPKPQQRETPDITQALSNSKAIFLIEVLATSQS